MVEENQNKDEQTECERFKFWTGEIERLADLDYKYSDKTWENLCSSDEEDLVPASEEYKDYNSTECKAEAIRMLHLLLGRYYVSNAMEEILSGFDLDKYIDNIRDLRNDVLDVLVAILRPAAISHYQAHHVLFNILSFLLDHSRPRHQREALSQLGRFASSTDEDCKLAVNQDAFDCLLRLCETNNKSGIQRKAISILWRFCERVPLVSQKLEQVLVTLRNAVYCSNDEEVLKCALSALACFTGCLTQLNYNIGVYPLTGVLGLFDAQFFEKLAELLGCQMRSVAILAFCIVSDVSTFAKSDLPCSAMYDSGISVVTEFLRTLRDKQSLLEESTRDLTTNIHFGDAKCVEIADNLKRELESLEEDSCSADESSTESLSSCESSEAEDLGHAENLLMTVSKKDLGHKDFQFHVSKDQVVEQSNSKVDKTEQNKISTFSNVVGKTTRKRKQTVPPTTLRRSARVARLMI